MTIESVIRQIAEERFKAFTYVFENWEDADTKLEKLPLPAIVCVMPSSGVLSMKNGRVHDKEYIALAFLDKVARDAEGEDNAETYTRMKASGARFIKALNEMRLFAPLDNVPYEVVCERLANIVTGVVLSIEITQDIGACLKDLPYDDGTL